MIMRIMTQPWVLVGLGQIGSRFEIFVLWSTYTDRLHGPPESGRYKYPWLHFSMMHPGHPHVQRKQRNIKSTVLSQQSSIFIPAPRNCRSSYTLSPRLNSFRGNDVDLTGRSWNPLYSGRHKYRIREQIYVLTDTPWVTPSHRAAL